MKTRRTAWRYLAWAAALPLVLALSSGCDEEEKKQYKLRFSHYNHIEDYEVSCADCHGEPKEGSFGPISHASCVDCHDDWIETKKVGKNTCGECHKERDWEAMAKMDIPEPAPPAPGVFIHTAALSNRCADCHGSLFAEGLEAVPEMKRSDRIRIRDEAHRWNMDCAACHADMDRDTPPPDHDRNWMKRHGQLGQAPDNACSMCHAEQSCKECHQEMMPDSHNNLWRLKTHGIQAAWDRERCMVCHEQDSCNACHAEIRPQSHNAAWEKNHCFQCHSGTATGTGCAFCHEGGIDSHPNPHPANWRQSHCRSCHVGTPEAEQCAVCHGPLSLREHPNPHAAGWEKRHCTQCHKGQLDGISCSACHGGNLLGNHPNPHGAGWTQGHCSQCHRGLNGVSCAECHGGDLLGSHPNPHGAGWTQAHCTQCHQGLNGVSCAACHGGDLLGNHPNPHGAGWTQAHCTQCHRGLNGVSCEACHGGDLLGNHPNPHPANFGRSHCNSCHAGSQAERECAVCHEGGGSVLVHEDFWPPVHNRFGDAANCFDCHY